MSARVRFSGLYSKSVTLNAADIIFLSRANNKELDEYVNKEICKKI